MGPALLIHARDDDIPQSPQVVMCLIGEKKYDFLKMFWVRAHCQPFKIFRFPFTILIFAFQQIL